MPHHSVGSQSFKPSLVSAVAALILLFCLQSASPQAPWRPIKRPPLTPIGKPVLPADLFSTYGVYGADSLQVVPVTDRAIPFKQAFEIQRDTAGQYFYSAGLSWNITANLANNDLMLLTFWVKNLNSDLHPLHVTPVLQDNVTYNKSLTGSAPSDLPGWVKYAIPFRMNQASELSGNGSSAILFFGDLAQSFQVGGIALEDLGQVPTPMPSTITSTFAFYYPGRGNPHAPWRLTAEQNIQATRMANLSIKVTKAGVAFPNATVQVNQTQSAFHWGSAVDGCNLDGQCLSPSTTSTYIANILKNFNTVVPENDFKWPNWECCRQYADDTLAFAQKNGLALRGHNLIWPSFTFMPADTASLTPSELATRIDNHFHDELGALKGEAYEWDVVNEPYGNNQVQGLIPGVPGVTPSTGVLGNASIAGWYSLAGQIDPKTVLNMNDDGIFDSKSAVQEAYDLALVKYIKSLGATVEGFSFESHFNQTAPVFSEMQATLDDFDPVISKYGVTEFDFLTIDPSLQRDLTADYMTFIFGQPKFNEFLMWGFWDGAHWLNSAPIYNLDWSLKPSGEVWQQLTQHTWQTHSSGITNSSGTYELRAFKGAYSLTASLSGKTCTVPLTLSEDDNITIPIECN